MGAGPSSPPLSPRWLACIPLLLLVAGGCSDEPEAPARAALRPAKLVEIAALKE